MAKKYQYTKEIQRFFKLQDNKQIVNCKELKVYAPKHYEDHKLMTISETVILPGILKLVINETYESVLLFTNLIETIPSSIDKITDDEDGTEYYVLNYVQGDIFINNVNIIKSSEILYRLFVVFVSLGKVPPFLGMNVAHLFDNDKKVNGVNLKVGKEIFGLVFSNMFRDPDNPEIPYRNTDMKKKPYIIGLRNFVYGPTSTSAKIMGAYLDDGLTGAALVHHPDKITFKIEQKLTQ